MPRQSQDMFSINRIALLVPYTVITSYKNSNLLFSYILNQLSKVAQRGVILHLFFFSAARFGRRIYLKANKHVDFLFQIKHCRQVSQDTILRLLRNLSGSVNLRQERAGAKLHCTCDNLHLIKYGERILCLELTFRTFKTSVRNPVISTPSFYLLTSQQNNSRTKDAFIFLYIYNYIKNSFNKNKNYLEIINQIVL